jgi:2-keto-3-deoxy-L-rhamnonate aldolase
MSDTPVPTFFAAEGSANYNATSPPLDIETQTKHSLFQVRGGIRGLVILGSTGEAIFIKRQERTELISSQRKALDEAGFKDRPIIAGTGKAVCSSCVGLM